ncbi:VOC family protein [Burkholderia glumae]|uniref:VOC family protein n=1 Tax=Burkholderia glumae TaxID=337 RepID=UPI0005C29491|nr:VOC family protein [Burkholderia glumae]MCM2495236.1 VOC family protein [Burkholderia glumae]MCM2546101.1 VOC family protein [Burkholderia glumae]MCQ0032285.1 VOC family protein [Burkholderia glumae]MCQ0037079.1 VOC family protein [Burkholderia glumae]QJW81847.1 VOC family protein [Burkholderia glumae]
MPLPMTRVILYTHDVTRLKVFYHTHFGLPTVEAIEGEWVVLDAGGVELALHRVGEPYRHAAAGGAAGSNAKFVFRVDDDIEARRAALMQAGVPMGAVRRYDGFHYRLCDGTDSEGNVFQLMQADDARA